MKPVKVGIDHFRMTESGMKEAIQDLLEKRNMGTLKSIHKEYVAKPRDRFTHYSQQEKTILYKISILASSKQTHNPGLAIIERGVDHFELEETDLKEAIQDFVNKYNMGEITKIYIATHHEGGTSGEPFDYGQDVLDYEVELKRTT